MTPNRMLALIALLLTGGTLVFAQAAKTDAAAKRVSKISEDWPDLHRYQEADRELKPPTPDENRVVFMGDSITDFWGRRPGTTFFPGKPYINRGISGQTTPQMLVRFRQDVIALQPKVVVILAGTNDIAQNTGPMTPQDTENNLMSMCDLARQNDIRVVLASVTPAAAFPWRPEIQPVEKILALNRWIKEYAATKGYVYLDYYSAMAGDDHGMKPGLSVDGVHPTKAGYEVMAPLADQAIEKALQQGK
jgi:lysophospholipase L1-like esterase